MTVYLIVDDDTGDAHVFSNRQNAINLMYYECKKYGAILYVAVKVHDDDYQCVSFGQLCPTEQEQLNYLYACDDAELNEIFEAYWCIRTMTVEDAE